MLYRSVDALVKFSAPILILVFVAAISPCIAESPDTDPLVKVYAELVPMPANQALSEIPDLGRKLLALRNYLRAGTRLVKRWSWTKEDIKAFQTSKEQQLLLDEVAAVSAHFAQA